MGTEFAEIRVRGRTIHVPSVAIDEGTVIVTGKYLKVAAIKDEELADGRVSEHPAEIVKRLKASGLRADLFTFAQRLPDVTPRHDYHLEWDNAATLRMTTYKDWLEKGVEYDVRKAIKKSAKLGVTTTVVPFDDELVRGIVDIYAESPIRQGKAFWHYRKDFDTVKHEAGTYLDRCEFICAHYEGELIGFIKIAYLGKIAATVHVIAKKAHFSKKATTAMLAKAVEICEQRGSTHLTYGEFVYNDPASSLTEFKRRHGFEKVLLPRYYVPLSIKGRIALKLGLHHGLAGMIPENVKRQLLKARAAFNARFRTPGEGTSREPALAATSKHGTTAD
jgi:Acetyltransferase (GNAT) family